MIKLVVITGQTATGKTKLALTYAEKYRGELINFDSRQIYRSLNIITGKDKREIVSKVHLYDIVDPKEYFSSFDYKQQALPIVEDIINRGKVPVFVGGTYLYLKHFLYDVETERIPPDWNLRKKLAFLSVAKLQNLLKEKNPDLYKRLNNSDRNNPQRLIRKIEIASHPIGIRDPGGYPFFNRFKKNETILVGLRFRKRENLVNAIKKRVEKRLGQGAVDEVRTLLKKGYTPEDPGLKTIGYQQLIRYVRGELSKHEAVNEWMSREIQYAKRQLTFMKKDKNIKWKYV